ncbi:MAG: NAD(P)/FAD-dependent oxidoreductase [Austwickia sp.]|jgi:sulfide:quinone oxidoreductase|nr:NAD(P)/FAD-dependent oxidoreductase [Austwickia sp.]MBK8436591.1 NAD(P)/FAD-dependent oxidoreductase [Austwickia sp.]MBK9102256.1 NAD(P)/FAD-dependent oxidoreductase [Austwickia sp.]
MARLLIIGAGTAGTMIAHHLRRALSDDWSITIVDRDNAHHYQPGYLFVAMGTNTAQRVVKPRDRYLPDGVEFIEAQVQRIDAAENLVRLEDGRSLAYDWIVVASGTTTRPDQVPGMADGPLWQRSIFDFYTLDGAQLLHQALERFEGGRILVHFCELPIKCPVAPLEFAFLVEDHFRKRRLRHRVDISYVTPLDGAFTKPVASRELSGLLEDRSIRLVTDFAVESVDNERSMLIGYDGRELPFDLLVTVPPNMGQQFVIDSGLGDDMGFIPVDKATLRSETYPNLFAIGDAANLPTSKAGAVAHFAAELFSDNFVAAVAGRDLPNAFDGHANCFIESGRGQALLLDFNYDTEPLTGSYPLAAVGPLRLLGRSRLNHLGKLAFEQLYWRLLLRGKPLPVPTLMSMTGKKPA